MGGVGLACLSAVQPNKGRRVGGGGIPIRGADMIIDWGWGRARYIKDCA